MSRPAESDYRLWSQSLYRRLYQALTTIANLEDTEAIVWYVMNALVEDAAPPYAIITGARAYRRVDAVYRLFAKAGQAGPVPIGFEVPADYSPVQKAIRRGWVLMRATDPDFDPRIEDVVGVRTYAAIALGPHKEFLVSFTLHEPVPDEEIIYALAAIRQVADMVLRHRELYAFIEQAREIQQSLLPREVPTFPGYEFAFLSRPAESVGGDVYDFIPVSRAILGVLIADAIGHGLPAALQARDVVVGVRMGVEEDLKIVRMMEKLSAVLRHVSMGSRFTPVFYAEVEWNGNVVYVNAGHVPPFILRANADASVQFLTVGGPVLGLPMEVAYQRSFERLQPGDLLVLYTDGITETTKVTGEEFGVQRLVEVVRRHRTEPLPAILERVFAAVDEFRDGLSQEDDQTLILIRKQAG
ncbi:MAG: PP2C family protein-serine/threonine phosphatase [Acidobacteria bacterium]|nr:PP2C family protein-serine/threonine phosphatase [Acidobacteriota bacterium]MDW7983253.1 PP2C family protein-serine/threonine phosphatase [Acidobacteriota bacterium]